MPNARYAEYVRRIEAEMGRRLDASAIVVQNHAKVLVGREGAGSPATKGGRLRYGARRSLPGEPPMKQTGRLQTSIGREREGMVARVGTNVIYGRILELLLNRPWLRRSLLEMSGVVRALLTRKI